MREAIGGTMLMNIVMVFLVVYIMFMAVVINYGRVFRVKNALITFIENEEGFQRSASDSVITKAGALGYNGAIHACYTQGREETKYFSVMVFINFQLPLVNNSVKIPVRGETSGIEYITDNTGAILQCDATDLSNVKFKIN